MLRRPYPIVTTWLVVTVLAACSGSSDSDNKVADRSKALDQALEELVKMPGGPPGAIVVVQRGADRTVHSVGVAELGSNAKPGVDDHMRIASASKAFNGAAALALIDDGVLSLDDTIGQRLPDLPAAWGKVTLRQLLNHTSGLPDYTRSDAFAKALQTAPQQSVSPAELMAFVKDDPVMFTPGTQYTYDNSDNIVVELMIEAATGQSYADVLKAKVFDPLGLDQTSLPTGSEMPDPFIHGYGLDANGKLEDESTVIAASLAGASGGIVSTPGDLNDFIRSYVGGKLFGNEVSAAQQDLFIPAAASEPSGPGNNSASLALFRYDADCGTMYGHTGNIFGYTQLAVASPDGRNSVTTSITMQRNQESKGQDANVFTALHRVQQAAFCLALE